MCWICINKGILPEFHQLFKLHSKPTSHIRAMANLNDQSLIGGMPDVLARMYDAVETKLTDLPE